MAIASKSGTSKRKRQESASAMVGLPTAVREASRKEGIALPQNHTLPKRPKTNNMPISLPRRKPPLWLLRLSLWERRLGVITGSLAVLMLTMYIWSVYSQKMWNQSYHQQGNLQRYERQLITTNEVLQNKMAQQGERETDLVPSTPQTAIFLKPAPQRPAKTPQTIVPQQVKPSQRPRGY